MSRLVSLWKKPNGGEKPPKILRIKIVFLQTYRVAVILLTVLLVRQHFQYLEIQGDIPITVAEVQAILPGAARLKIDSSTKAGLFVFDANLNEIGYAIKTSPQSNKIIGYAGPSDVLLVFGKPTTTPNPQSEADATESTEQSVSKLEQPTRKVLGIAIRHSWDTRRHIKWVKQEEWFMEFWNGRDWSNISSLNYYDEYMEGVSAATLSSMGIARSIQHRIRIAEVASKQKKQTHFFEQLRVSSVDYGIWIAIFVGVFITFKPGWKRNKRFWVFLKIVAFVYVGFLNGSLIALSLLTGYASHGIAWQLAPGLTSLVLISFFVPLTTRRQPYCSHICPHGAAQQLLSRYSPWKKTIPQKYAAGLKWIPFLLIAIWLSFLVLRIEFEFADLEPFDAYLIRQTGWVSLAIALVGLAISAFVPMAYCKYGCPTGTLLEFVRTHGRADKFNRKDFAGLFLLALTWLLINQYESISHLTGIH